MQVSNFRYTINRQTYTKVAGIPQPDIQQIEGLSELDDAAERIVELALEDPGVVFQVHDTRGPHFFSVYAGPEEDEGDLFSDVLEALNMFDNLYCHEENLDDVPGTNT